MSLTFEGKSQVLRLQPRHIPCNILENRRRAKKKNVTILADILPLSASRHNTMFLKNWQPLLCVYFSCVLDTKQKQADHNKIKREGDFE